MKGIVRFVEVPLGMDMMLGVKNPHWILTAALAAASAASSIFGAAKANKANRERKKILSDKERTEKAWYDKAYNTDYLDTKAGQNLLRRAQEVQDNYIRKADGASAVGGGTTASSALAKESANRTLGNTIANIGAQDTARKQQVEDQHNKNQMGISEQKSQLAYEQALNTSTAAQNMSNALMSAIPSVEGVGKAKGATPTGDTQATPIDDSYAKKNLFKQAVGLINV